MNTLRFTAMPTEYARAFQQGALDANGQPPERHLSDGDGMPCRHCLQNIAAGDPYLILAYRPFSAPQPYAELGPIFLHADACPRYEAADVPPIVTASPQMLIRGYSAQERIVYGTGQVVPTTDITDALAERLARPEVAFVHVRSAANNCYQCRVERA